MKDVLKTICTYCTVFGCSGDKENNNLAKKTK